MWPLWGPEIKILFDGLLSPSALFFATFGENHNAGGKIGKILHLSAVAGLAIHRDVVVWEADVDMVAAVPIPRDHLLVGFKLYARIKSQCAVERCEVGDEIIKSTIIHRYLLRRNFGRSIR
jgi:hypothetical protein